MLASRSWDNALIKIALSLLCSSITMRAMMTLYSSRLACHYGKVALQLLASRSCEITFAKDCPFASLSQDGFVCHHHEVQQSTAKQHCFSNNTVSATTLFQQQHCFSSDTVSATTVFQQQHCFSNNTVSASTQLLTSGSWEDISIEDGPLPSLPKDSFACFHIIPFAEMEASLTDASQPSCIDVGLCICGGDVGVHQLCL